MEVKYVANLNEKVAGIIEELKKEIVSRFQPKSIIITGSFGRGEATVIEKNGELKFLSDCEVMLLPYRWLFSRRKIDEFEKEFYKRTGLKIEIWGFTPTLYLTIPLLNKKIKPTIANYDLKYGSKVIYGKNYLDRIPAFKPEDIPLWEGIRLLFNRMAEALKYFSFDNPSEEMIFWTDKIILACQDALLLSLGKYNPSYKERNQAFMKSVGYFSLQCIKSLAKLAEDATERKMNLIQDKNTSNKKVKYWFEVSRICDEVFRYIMEKCGIGFKDYLDFQEKYLNSELRNYTTLPFNNVILQNIFRFLKKRVVRYKLPTLKMLLKPYIHWDHVIYSLIPLVYFSLNENHEINAEYLDRVVETIDLLGEKININGYSFEDWKHVRDITISYWQQMRL